MVKKILKYGTLALVFAVLVAQFVNVERTNPPVDPSASFEAVAKPSPETAAVVGRACRDCHSNQTAWPWYSHIAPVSWLIASDVKEGRAKLNFSQWNIYGPEMTRIKLGQICEEVRKAEMPPAYYVPMHPEAKLTAADVSAMCSSPVASVQ
jgi:hypothetical protein